jgi:hypothetical protein
VLHVVIREKIASSLDGAASGVRTFELKRIVSCISGRKVAECGTVRRKEAEVVTAKMTAILSDVGNHQRTSADPSC